jgi:hypothetical protein
MFFEIYLVIIFITFGTFTFLKVRKINTIYCVGSNRKEITKQFRYLAVAAVVFGLLIFVSFFIRYQFT